LLNYAIEVAFQYSIKFVLKIQPFQPFLHKPKPPKPSSKMTITGAFLAFISKRAGTKSLRLVGKRLDAK